MAICRLLLRCLLAYGAFLPPETAMAGTPRIACAEPEFRFGAVENNQSLTHVFTIRNDGSAPLVIGKVWACCGLTAELAAKTIAPGSNAILNVVFALGARSGEQQKSVFVASNDPRTPFLQLKFTGQAVAALGIRPAFIDFGALDQSAATNAEVSIIGNHTNAFQITNATVNVNQLTVDCRQGDSQNVWRAQISTRAPLAIGPNKALVTLLTNLPKAPKIQIPVWLTVVGDLIVTPQEILLSAGPQPVTRFVTIRSRSGKPFRVLTVAPPEPHITAVIEPTPSGGYRIELKNIAPQDILNGQALIITTDHDQASKIIIPFRIITR